MFVTCSSSNPSSNCMGGRANHAVCVKPIGQFVGNVIVEDDDQITKPTKSISPTLIANLNEIN